MVWLTVSQVFRLHCPLKKILKIPKLPHILERLFTNPQFLGTLLRTYLRLYPSLTTEVMEIDEEFRLLTSMTFMLDYTE